MKNLIAFFAAFIVSFSIAFAQSKNVKNSNTIVIVHGAWSSAADWKQVIADLHADGNSVIAVNLPGHGSDHTPVSGISLKVYVEVVKKAIGTKQNVILVGHSFGGIVVSQVAEEIPAQLKKLVYVAAYVPRNGESLLTIANTDADSHIGKYLRPDEKAGIIGVAKEGIVDSFAADAPQPVADYLANNLKAEPLAPLATPATVTETNFGSVFKVYVHTHNDHVIGYPLQVTMAKNAGITRSYTLPSSHTPFISLPGVLAGVLNQEAK